MNLTRRKSHQRCDASSRPQLHLVPYFKNTSGCAARAADMTFICGACLQYDTTKQSQDPDHLAALALEVVPDHSCLIFCPTKKNCENVAMLLCKLMPK